MLNKFPTWLVYSFYWLIAFVLLLGLFQWEAMHMLDLRLARALQLENSRMSSDILVVDVPGDGGTPAFRERVGALLEHVAAHPGNLPQKIGLDIAFSSDTENHREVLMGLESLSFKGIEVPVYGAMNVLRDGEFDPQYQTNHIVSLYARMEGVGHTWFRASKDLLSAWPFYEACRAGSSGLQGLPVLLTRSSDGGSICDVEGSVERRIPLGGALLQQQAEQVLGFDKACPSQWRRYAADCLETAPVLRGKTLIVGRLKDDRPFQSGPFAERPGPEIVAWAVNDLQSAKAPVLLNSVVLHLGLALLTAGVVLILFFGLLRFIRSWRLSPWRTATLAGSLALVLPFGLVGLMRVADRDFSQVLLPILTMLLTLALAMYYQSRLAHEAERKRAALPDLDSAAYDVFVSYRHSHQDWVEGALKPLLNDIRRVDGRKLSVFFDSEGIHTGDNWASRLGRVIHESRIFLAVLTPDYFEANAQGRKVCAWEMEQALQRHAENSMVILPVFHAGYSPEQHTPTALPHLGPIQGPSSASADLAERISKRILDSLDREA